ncbi:MAG: N-acetylmuramoyl-L-alanine amidase [Oscillospiraceae bacterium]
MKKPLALLLTLLLLISSLPVTAAGPNGLAAVEVYNYALGRYDPPVQAEQVVVTLGGVPLAGDMPAVNWQGRTLLPIRAMSEALGADVEWVPERSQAVLRRESDTIVLTLGSSTALVNGIPVPLPDGVPAVGMRVGLGGERTMVPLRFVSEHLGAEVSWDQRTYTAAVTVPTPTPSPEVSPVPSPEVSPTPTPTPTPEPTPEPTPPPSPVPDPNFLLTVPQSPERFLIALDAGHGGTASGAVYERIQEKHLALAMTKKLEEMLLGMGYRVIMTRSDDRFVSLDDRCKIANDAKADVFVSIHLNALENNTTYEGFLVCPYVGSKEGEALAKLVSDSGSRSSGAVNRGWRAENFAVTRKTRMPAVLVETGFMSYHYELMRLADDDYQTLLMRGVADGVVRYLSRSLSGPKEGLPPLPSAVPSDFPDVLPVETLLH